VAYDQANGTFVECFQQADKLPKEFTSRAEWGHGDRVFVRRASIHVGIRKCLRQASDQLGVDIAKSKHRQDGGDGAMGKAGHAVEKNFEGSRLGKSTLEVAHAEDLPVVERLLSQISEKTLNVH